jgi:hypothetical protein
LKELKHTSQENTKQKPKKLVMKIISFFILTTVKLLVTNHFFVLYLFDPTTASFVFTKIQNICVLNFVIFAFDFAGIKYMMIKIFFLINK